MTQRMLWRPFAMYLIGVSLFFDVLIKPPSTAHTCVCVCVCVCIYLSFCLSKYTCKYEYMRTMFCSSSEIDIKKTRTMFCSSFTQKVAGKSLRKNLKSQIPHTHYRGLGLGV